MPHTSGVNWTEDLTHQKRRLGVEPAVVLVGAALALGLTLLFGMVLLQAVNGLGSNLSEQVLFGVLLLTTSMLRLAAGLFTGRMYRRRYGMDTRGETMGSVVVAMAAGWAGYALIVAMAAAITGADVAVGRLLLELPRWLLEGAAGAALVGPGEREELDPRLRRFALRGNR